MIGDRSRELPAGLCAVGVEDCCTTGACGVRKSEGVLTRVAQAAVSTGFCNDWVVGARAACGNCEKMGGGGLVLLETDTDPALVAAGVIAEGAAAESESAVVGDACLI